MATSAATVFTGLQGGRGDNSGSAAVLDTYGDFNQDYYYRLWEQQKATAAKEKEAKAKEQNKAWAEYSMEMPDVWQVDSPFLERDLMEYDKTITDMRLAGKDPENMYGPDGKKVKELQTGLLKQKAIATDNEKFYNDARAKIDADKGQNFDIGYAQNWLKEYADPNKTPQDRAKMRMEGSPYKLNITVTDFVADTISDETQDGRRIFRDPKAHEAKVRGVIDSPNGDMIFEALKKDGEDKESFTKRMVAEGQLMFPPERKPSPQGSSSSSSGGGGGWGDKLSINVESGTFGELVQGVPNTVDVKRKGTNDDLPPIEVVDDGGAAITFQPVRFLKTNDGWKVYGKKQTTKAATAMSPATTVTENVTIDYGKNHGAFVAQMEGFDLYKDVDENTPSGNKPKGEKASGTKTGFTGVPEGGF